MKAQIKLLFVFAMSLFFVNCNQTETNFPMVTVPGAESVHGKITNENGEPLDGIRIEVFCDANLTKHFVDNGWDSMSEEDRKQFTEKEPVISTDSEGIYYISQTARYGTDSLDVYVVAIDTAKIYQSQVQKGQIEYIKIEGVNGHLLVSGEATIDVVIRKETM